MLFGDNAVIRVNAFANAIDTAERRRNSMLMRDFVTALPHELDTKQQRILLQVIAGELGERYQTPVMWSHHRPCREGDQRNSHGHIGLPTRTFEVERSRFGKKLRVLDDKRTGSEEFRIIRELVERATNRALELAGSPARVSLKRRADRLGQPNLGQACTGLERRAAKAAGIKVEGLVIGDLLTRPDYEPVTDKGKELRAHLENVAQIREREQHRAKEAEELGAAYTTPAVQEAPRHQRPASTRGRRIRAEKTEVPPTIRATEKTPPHPTSTRGPRGPRQPRQPRAPRLPRAPRVPRPERTRAVRANAKRPVVQVIKPCPKPGPATPIPAIDRLQPPATAIAIIPPAPILARPTPIPTIEAPSKPKTPAVAIAGPPIPARPAPIPTVEAPKTRAVAIAEPPIPTRPTPIRKHRVEPAGGAAVAIEPPTPTEPPTPVPPAPERAPVEPYTTRTPGAPQAVEPLGGTRAYGQEPLWELGGAAQWMALTGHRDTDWERVGRVVKPETTDMARLFVEEAKWVAQEDGQESRVMTFTESRSLLDKIEDTIAAILERASAMWDALTADEEDTKRLIAHRKGTGAGGQSGEKREKMIPGSGAGTPTRPGRLGTDPQPRPIERPRRE